MTGFGPNRGISLLMSAATASTTLIAMVPRCWRPKTASSSWFSSRAPCKAASPAEQGGQSFDLLRRFSAVTQYLCSFFSSTALLQKSSVICVHVLGSVVGGFSLQNHSHSRPRYEHAAEKLLQRQSGHDWAGRLEAIKLSVNLPKHPSFTCLLSLMNLNLKWKSLMSQREVILFCSPSQVLSHHVLMAF